VAAEFNCYFFVYLLYYIEAMTRIRRIERWERIFFITFNLERGVHFLTERERDAVLQVLDAVRLKMNCLVLGYVVMPNHIHLLLRIAETPVDKVLRNLKSRSGFVLNKMRKTRGAIWQRSYFDFICRKRKDVGAKLAYIHENPVEARLVISSSDWKWSSYGHYAKTGEAMIAVDFLDLSGDPEELLWPGTRR